MVAGLVCLLLIGRLLCCLMLIGRIGGLRHWLHGTGRLNCVLQAKLLAVIATVLLLGTQ